MRGFKNGVKNDPCYKFTSNLVGETVRNIRGGGVEKLGILQLNSIHSPLVSNQSNSAGVDGVMVSSLICHTGDLVQSLGRHTGSLDSCPKWRSCVRGSNSAT